MVVMKYLLLVTVLLSAFCLQAQGPAIENEHLIQPADLAQLLQSKNPKPLIFNIGPRMLYDQAHITGAELIGPASDPRGLDALKTRVKALAKHQAIVLDKLVQDERPEEEIPTGI